MYALQKLFLFNIYEVVNFLFNNNNLFLFEIKYARGDFFIYILTLLFFLNLNLNYLLIISIHDVVSVKTIF